MDNPLHHQVLLAIGLATALACSDDAAPSATAGLGETGDSGTGDMETGDSRAEDSSETSDSGADDPRCEAHDPIVQCLDNHVYWENGCDEPTLLAECEFGCADGACLPNPCVNEFAGEGCHEGHIYWLDSCGNPTMRKAACEHGCADGRCSPAPPFELEIHPDPLLWLCPTHIAGDTEFAGNGPDVEGSVELVAVNDNLVAKIAFSLAENKPDWTSAQYQETLPLWAPAPGCKIKAILTGTHSSCAYTDTDHSLDTCWPEQKGGVHKFQFMADAKGKDVGKCEPDQAHANVYFSPVKLLVQCP